jgi:uroporphyrinogen-III synthase
VKAVEASLLEKAKSAEVMTYGSPSAVKAWVALVGLEAANSKVNACIGATSAKACASIGITQNVVFPESPGIEGWAECVVGACRERSLLPA